MYKDVARRILASILTICMIGSTPGMNLLAAEGGETGATTHTYAYGSGELETTNNYIGDGEWIANAYVVESNSDSTKNAQALQAVGFALDKDAKYGDGAQSIKNADYTVTVYTYDAADDVADVLSGNAGTVAATKSGTYEADDCGDDDYFTVDMGATTAAGKDVILGSGEKFAVKVTLSNATYLKDGSEEAVTTDKIYYKSSSDSNAISYVNGTKLSGQTAHIKATTAETFEEIEITGLSFAEKSSIITVGEQKTVDVVYAPAATSQRDLDWASNKTSVATVDENGVVTAVAPGTAKITATSKSNSDIYATISIEVCKDIAGLTYSTIADQTYQGTALEPGFEVHDGDKMLSTADGDYTVTYSNNINVGTAIAEVTANGNGYKGQKIVNFNIIPVEMGNGTVTAVCDSAYEYTGEAVTLEDPANEIVVTYKNKNGDNITLKYDEDGNGDFKIKEYKNNETTGNQACAVLEGTGNYTGTLNCYFQIKKSIVSDTITTKVDTPSFTYDGEAHKSAVTVMDGTTELELGRDYKVEYPTDVTSAGEKKIVITGVGAYAAYEEAADGTPDTTKPLTREVSYTIHPRQLTNGVDFAELPNQLTGVTADSLEGLSVTYGGTELTKDTDYTVAVVEADGNVTVTLTGQGNFQGTLTQTVGTGTDIKTCTVTVAEATYSGEKLEPKVTVTDGSTEVDESNYTLTWKNNVNAGTDTATVIISGKGSYAGEKTVNFTINPREVSQTTIDYDTSVVYHKLDPDNASDAITSEPTLTYNNRTLKKGTDYTVVFTDNTSATASAKMTITGTGNYTGTVTKTYRIDKADLEASYMTYEGVSAAGYPYTGSEIEPQITVKQNGVELEEGTDYEVSYDNNIKVGTATIYVEGLGNYANSEYLIDFEITKVGIADATVAAIADQEYDGTEKEPALTVEINGVSLTKGTDYDAVYSNNVEAGQATVKLTGKNNYSGTQTVTFNILKDISNDTISVDDIASQSYAGTDITPGVVVTDSYLDGTEYTLVEDDDYTLAYADNNAIGTATVTITGKGYYKGTKEVTFEIGKGDLSAANSSVKVALANANPNSRRFTGSEITPAVKVTCNGNTLALNTDYVVSYFYNTNVTNSGATRLRIEGIGKFDGKRTLYFDIIPKDITYDSAIDIEVEDIDALVLEEKGYPTVTVKDTDRDEISGEELAAGGTGGYLLSKGETKDYVLGDVTVGTDGQATVEIIGQNNYSGTIEVPFTVNQTDIEDSSKVTIKSTLPDDQTSFEYTGSEIIPSPVVTVTTDGVTVTLEKDVDYTVSTGAVNVGTGYKYTVTFIGKYAGTYNAKDTFAITAKNINASDVTLDAIENQAYTGSALTPAVTLHYNDAVVDSSNYTVAYSNNVESGATATVTITGKNNFTGSRTTTFQIRPSINDGTLTVTGLENAFVYTSKEIEPSVTVKSGNKTLTYGVDYTLSYSNNINANDYSDSLKKAYVTIKGTGEYGGEKSFPFTISRKNMLDSDVDITVEDAVFTGGAIQPKVKITYHLPDGSDYVLRSENTDTQLRDYDASVSSSSNVGDEVTVTIKPSGLNFYVENGSFIKKFSILPKPIVDDEQNLGSDFTVNDIGEIQYKAEQTVYTPDVILKDKSRDSSGTPQTSGSTFYTLVEGQDYTITYANNTRPGKASYTITGIGNYSGTYKGYFTILASIKDATVSITNQIYTGDPIEPDFTVSFGEMILRKDVDYQFEFSDNTNAGQASLKIIGSGSYAGSQQVYNFTILPKPIGDEDVVMTHVYGSYTYTGENIYPDPHFTYNGRKLAYGTDFTCTYADVCSKAGEWYSFEVNGTGNFTGTLTKEYKIGDNYTENTVAVNLSGYSFEYTGKPIQPMVSVALINDSYTLLRQNIDYQFEYEDNIDVGTAHVNTWGDPKQSIYAGNVSVDFEITAKSISDEDIVVAAVADQTYTRKAIEPTPAVTWNGEELIAGEDFNYIYKNNTDAGTATVTIQGIGNFTDSQTVEFTIHKKDISEAASGITIEDIADQIYTGNALEPKPEILWGEEALDSRTDYTLTYENNVELGEATLTIQGIGNYTGTVTKTFDIIKVPVERMEVEYQKVWQYTGNPIEPTVKISYEDGEGNRIELDNSEFNITYKNTIDSGEETGLIIISGNGNYEGTKRCYYTIEPRKLSDATITMDRIPNQVLDAENKAEPEPVLIFRPDSKTSYTLVKGADYEVSYSNNTVAGQNGTVTVTGLHNFTGTISQEFYIGSDLKKYIEKIEFVETPEYIYNGKVQAPEISVTLNGSADLVEGRDYEILYDGQKLEDITDDAYATKAGTHKVSVNGLKPYGGGLELTYKIEKRNISKVRFDIEDQSYTGSEVHPFIVGTDTVANTRLGEDDSTATITGDISKDDMWVNRNAFTTSYEGNCTDLGTATVEITATDKSNYTGSVTVQFNIVAKDLQSSSISSSTVTKQNYTGSAVKPGITLTDTQRNDKGEAFDATVDSKYYTLVEGKDYGIDYTENVYPGTVTMTITGKGHYTGTLTKQFEIVADLANAVIAPIPAQQYKNGEAVTPTLTVTLGERTLRENFDYTVSYTNNKDRGTATATIYPVAGSMFTGSKSVTFEISRELTAQTAKMVLVNTSFMYTGSAIKPAVGVVYGDGQTLTAGTDFTVTYANNVNVGTATVKVTGTGAFTGTLTGTFTIIKRSIIRCTFSNVTNQKYTGNATAQNLVVTDGTKVLVENQDYKVSYVNNTNPGTATMTITGLGNYGGIKTIRYVIDVPDMTKVKAKASSTSVKLSWSKVNGADGYAIYNKDNKLIAKTTSTSYKHKKLKSMKTYTYKVRPYVISDGATYYGGFYKTLSVVTKPSKPSIKVSAGTSQVKVSWKKIKGVSGYVIYRSTKKSGKYKKIKTIKKASTTSFTNKNLSSNKKYYYKVRAYKKVNGKKVYSSYSSVKSATTK